MKRVVELTEAEDTTLQQLSVNHKHRDMRTRASGVMLLGRKAKLTEIASKLGVSGQSVYNWAHAWHDQGVCSLLVDHKGGRPRALSDATVATAVEAARAESMTLKQIAQHVEAAHGAPLPSRLDTPSVALKHAGFTEHHMVLFYLSAYSPELNLIEIVWKHAKYRWRRFVTWTKETIDAEIASLLGAYGLKFQINFSWTLTSL